MSAGAGGRGKVAQLMEKPPEQWAAGDLAGAVQTAVELELSTLPPYLCGLWSIEDSSSEASSLIRTIILDEMFHLGLVCNMLVGIGGTPQLVSTMPKYPGPLPGGIRPDLKEVYLSGLTKDSVADVFMQIEYPEQPLAAATETYPTIGAFYDYLSSVFEASGPSSLDPSKQQHITIFGNAEVKVLDTVADVTDAITEIKEQGEGTSQSPDVPGFGTEIAHYYSFGEIYNGMHFVQGADGTWGYTGPPPIPFPAAYPMAQVPPGGWPSPSDPVKAQIDAFNTAFTTLLQALEAAWADGDETKLNDAVNQMFSLKDLAMPLMTTPLPSGEGNYGPEFRVTT
jgi:hypothetical protein